MIITPETGPIAIWGYGREGRATHDFLRAHYPDHAITIINDDALENGPADAKALSGQAGIDALASGQFGLVIKSPGISLYRPEIAAAKANGTRFSSSTNLWMERHRDAFVIGVTGTKGKSTTASLIHYLCELYGKKSKLLGNVGSALIASAPGNDVTVLELSSYQIADLDFAPSLALITNLHPEHGPWHQGHENYYRDKMRLAQIHPSIPLIVNEQDLHVQTHIIGRDHVVAFEAPAGFHVADNTVWYGDQRLDLHHFPLAGRHNLVNLAGALTAIKTTGFYDASVTLDFAGFVPLPHRLQVLRLSNGVVAVNDSISTIPETTRAALDVYADKRVHLLLGGVDRGQEFGVLLAHLLTLPNLASLHFLKGTGERLAVKSEALGLPFEGPYQAFDDAVRAALAAAKTDEIVLLSPGAPSQIEFKDFEERGARFLELCQNFKG